MPQRPDRRQSDKADKKKRRDDARQKSTVKPPGAKHASADAPGGSFKDTMDPVTQFWNQCRSMLLQFRATTNCSFTPDQQAAALAALADNLELQARTTDPTRRTSPYNLPSLYQDQMTALSSKTVYLAKKWLTDGCPQVPLV